MNEFFERAFVYLFQNEGSTFTDDPSDSGGPTKFGVTQKAYEHWLGHSVDVSEIKNMSLDMAKQFYFECYWKAVSCDKLTSLAISTAIFDSAVLYGIANAALMAQKAANSLGCTLKIDGILGDKSTESLNSLGDEDFIRAFSAMVFARIEWIVQVNPKNEKYRDGWVNRGTRLLTLTGGDGKT
jgi:lysozyme family protein